ncbi:hypothetical protein LOD99_303 [Oopsacas minuta]|uniref:Uncharacterized protein n=1 Tax=Oopsacas minuta TaxID=111878 RepID=A0AAV7KBU2_9METZ|nr:hypothetical protein LOD99_303 [Oopsacas minuta]
MEKANSRNLEKDAYTKLRTTLEEGLLVNLLTCSGVVTKELETKHLSKEVTLHLAMSYIELLLEISAYARTNEVGKCGDISEFNQGSKGLKYDREA